MQLHWSKVESLNPVNPASTTRRRTSLVVVSSRDDGRDLPETISGAPGTSLNNVDVCIAPDTSFSPAELYFSSDEVLTISMCSTGITHRFSLSHVVCTSPPTDNSLTPIIITNLPEASTSFQLWDNIFIL